MGRGQMTKAALAGALQPVLAKECAAGERWPPVSTTALCGTRMSRTSTPTQPSQTVACSARGLALPLSGPAGVLRWFPVPVW